MSNEKEKELKEIRERILKLNFVDTVVNPKCTIVTHDGFFHADEVLACVFLLLSDDEVNFEILRTRDQEKIKQAKYAVDVGGICDPRNNRFDHHQLDFKQTFNEGGIKFDTKLSSAGLVYSKYYDYFNLMFYDQDNVENNECDDTLVEILMLNKVYSEFVEHIDGIDNGVEGINQCDQCKKLKGYKNTTDLYSRVRILNDPNGDQNEAFRKSMLLCLEEFTDMLYRITKEWLPKVYTFHKDLSKRNKIHDSNQIMVMTEQYYSWKDDLNLIESQDYNTGKNKVLFAVFQNPKGEWNVQAASDGLGNFSIRKALKHGGLNGSELSKAYNIEDCIFVHSSGFIGANKTKKGAIEMAIKSLN